MSSFSLYWYPASFNSVLIPHVARYTALAMTKLDILDKLDEVKIGVSYHRGGHRLEHYPSSVKQFEGVEVVSLHSCT